jgi:hypothetical protein
MHAERSRELTNFTGAYRDYANAPFKGGYQLQRDNKQTWKSCEAEDTAFCYARRNYLLLYAFPLGLIKATIMTFT